MFPMFERNHTFQPQARQRSARPMMQLAGAVALAASALTGCSRDGEANRDKSATQVAAKIDNREVTVHQVNHALQAQRGLRADQAEADSAKILERLIDQDLAVAKANSLKIDRDPAVVQQLQASRSEIIARAYFDKIAEGVAKPTPEEVTAYYNDHPALFRTRRVYQLQEVSLQAAQAQLDAVKRFVEGGKPVDDLLIYLRSNGINYTTNQVVRAAEQVPMNVLPSLAKLRDGQSLMVPSGTGAQVLALVESRLQPITEERARPAIEQFMINERKRKVINDDVKALRTAAKVEYMGKFADAANRSSDKPNATDAAAAAARATPPPVVAAPPTQKTATAPTEAAEQALSTSVINKGLGLK
jgi:EpsD family peptidyl-prolyl cis-trans isomerase